LKIAAAFDAARLANQASPSPAARRATSPPNWT
jgi:hypothetical protein